MTWRIIQDYFSAPRIMGRSVEVSPLEEIFAVLAGGEIGGVVGALVAVPLLALLRILWAHLKSKEGDDVEKCPSLRSRSSDDGSPPCHGKTAD